MTDGERGDFEEALEMATKGLHDEAYIRIARHYRARRAMGKEALREYKLLHVLLAAAEAYGAVDPDQGSADNRTISEHDAPPQIQP